MERRTSIFFFNQKAAYEVLSAKDAAAPLMRDFDSPFVYEATR